VAHVVGGWGVTAMVDFEAGPEIPFGAGGDTASGLALTTQAPARVDSVDALTTEQSRRLWDRFGLRSALAAPIVVDGRIWGAISVGRTSGEPFAPGAELRLGDFANLVAQAVANAAARNTLATVASEQAALRRVATLVAAGPTEDELLATVAAEVGRLFDAQTAHLWRYEVELARVVGGWNVPATVETAHVPQPGPLVARIREPPEPARRDDYQGVGGVIGELVRETGIRSAVGAPIVVDGAVWGAIVVSKTGEELFPEDAERRLGDFAALVAQAIA